ncbi:MAG TPA: META domain-containing protein [Paracoccus sp. (in: a-proteobacteria)]|nr:META domain-containing protein [Paracoccus sp. (in: a-proteobacteria)]
MPRNLVAAGALGLAACSGPVASGGPGSGAATVFDPALLLPSRQRFNVAALDGRPLPDGMSPWIERDGNRLSGHGGCNRFGGPVQIGGTSIRVGALASTRMACPPPVMEAEGRLQAALRQVDGARGTPGGEVELLAGARPVIALSPVR